MFYSLFTHPNSILRNSISKQIIKFCLQTEGWLSSGGFVPPRQTIIAPRSTNYIEKDAPATCDVFIQIVQDRIIDEIINQ